MLNQVFLNILMNAIHSIEDLKAYDTNYIGKIKLKTEIVEDFLRISILDNGKGISASQRKKVTH